MNYFRKFENEYGLLENLESWEFIEWSEATEDRYIKPVSFVTNMLYKGAIESAANLYSDKDLLEKSKDLWKTINELSFNGKYFRDNARRIDNKLVVTPLKAGSTKAVVSGTVRDTLLVATINITVDASFPLYTLLENGELVFQKYA